MESFDVIYKLIVLKFQQLTHNSGSTVVLFLFYFLYY